MMSHYLHELSNDSTNRLCNMRVLKDACGASLFEFLDEHCKKFDLNWCCRDAPSAEDKMTPLTYVVDQMPRVGSNSLESIIAVVDWLVFNGADMWLADGCGLTPLQTLEQYRNPRKSVV